LPLLASFRQTKPMSDPQDRATRPSPTLPLDRVLAVISNSTRWRLLRELASGDQLMVLELAERCKISADLVSKHLAILRNAGIVLQGRNRLYQIAPQFLTDKTERILDFGYCLLRMNVGSQT
jgi:DNA-binding transcriptional ArsR family regulator